MMMMKEENKDFTQYYNEWKEREKEARDRERNEKIKARRLFTIMKNAIIIIVLLLLIIPFWKEAKEYKDVFFTYNVAEQLEYMYHGKFVIISPTFNKEDMVTPNGLYMVKDEKNDITFRAYKQGNILITDYDQYLYKKYVLEYIEKNNIDFLYYEDTKQQNVNEELYWFKFGMKIESFDEIQDAVEKIMKLCQYINQKAKQHFDFEAIQYKPVIILNDFEGYMSSDVTYYTSSYYTNKIKTEYVIYVEENHITDEDITNEIKTQFYKPGNMKLIVNGIKCVTEIGNHTIDVNPLYDYFISDYSVNFGNIIDKLNCLEEYEVASTGKLQSIQYKGKIYQFDNINEITNKKIPYRWSMSMIKDFFGADIIYDYDNKTINIIISN